MMEHTLHFKTIQQAQYAESALYHNAIECLSHEVRFLGSEPVLQFSTNEGLSKFKCRLLESEAMSEISSFNESPKMEKVEGVVYAHTLSFDDSDNAEVAQACIKQALGVSCDACPDDDRQASVLEFTTQERLPVAQQKALKQACQADSATFNTLLTQE